jgi:HTH-type transcriptional regulator/antitoxin HigA
MKNTKYFELIKRFPLRPITTEAENDRAAEACDELTDRINDLSPAEEDYLEVLTDLIIKFESRWDDEEITPVELIKYAMEQGDLTQNDLIPQLGSASRVSEFLNGKRKLSLQQAKNLSKRFKLKLEALLAD